MTHKRIPRTAAVLLASAMSFAAQAGDITGAGASFPYPIYAKWAEGYKAATGTGLNYQSIGSSGGIRQIRAKTVAFGATDAPVKGEELDRDGMVQFPAIIGGTGSGKTTLLNLLPRFYDVTQGCILIDGVDITTVTLESLRQNIGIVQQDVYLFNGTFRENIAYGDFSATDEEIEEAARRANIHDYIVSQPQGYDTQVGERGVKLSGGQKQRISIARVFLKNPPILILDEATSALDNVTELLIQQALDQLCTGRTTLVVAHRLSTVKGADKIVVLTGRGIEEEGTHQELLDRDGIYAGLYRSQFLVDRA